MFISNLNPQRGMLNGTRLIVLSLHELFIHGKILSGSHKGQECFIPRIDILQSDTEYPFKMTQRQFPVIPAFAKTINKSQGQSRSLSVYLPSSVFSRTRFRNNLKILVCNNGTKHSSEGIALIKVLFFMHM